MGIFHTGSDGSPEQGCASAPGPGRSRPPSAVARSLLTSHHGPAGGIRAFGPRLGTVSIACCDTHLGRNTFVLKGK